MINVFFFFLFFTSCFVIFTEELYLNSTSLHSRVRTERRKSYWAVYLHAATCIFSKENHTMSF